jgi:ferritin-like metal-binding protein YciE
MSLDSLQALLIEQLQDIYYAEKKLVKALPKMASGSNTPELSNAFTNHLAETEEHVSRLEQAFELLGVAAKSKKCPAIEGLIEEGAEMLEEEGASDVLDAGIIASAQRVEHYEIAAYGNARTFAEALGHDEVVTLLEATLKEEHAANELLSSIATETVLPAALEHEANAGDAESGDDDEEEESEPKATRTPAKQGRARPARPSSRH